MEAYRKEIQAREGALEQNPESDAWRHAQKAGAPMDALLALRREPQATTALTAARDFCATELGRLATFLLLLGPTRVGKTVAATHVVLEFCKRWQWNTQSTGQAVHPVEYADASSLTGLSAFEAASREYVDRLTTAPLLVLEDAGNEGTDLGKGLFVELLMSRDKKHRRTVVSSNLRPAPFRARYGDAVAERMRGAGLVPNLWADKPVQRKLRAVS
jgi:hypothetical protein